MRDFRDAKAMAQSLRQALSDTSVTVTHSQCLELIAKAFGLDNWNILAAKIDAARPAAAAEPAPEDGERTLYCSFCGKSQHEVKRLIAGPSVFICNGCVSLCDGILLDLTVSDLIGAARAKRPDADLVEIARDALTSFSDEGLERCRQGVVQTLEHLDWSIRQTEATLSRESVERIADDRSREKRPTRHPLAGKSPDQVLAHRAELEARAAKVRQDADLIDRVLAERAAHGPNAAA